MPSPRRWPMSSRGGPRAKSSSKISLAVSGIFGRSWKPRVALTRGPVELKFFAATDVGRQRDHNEDNYLVDPKLHLFVVADGMGGHAAGEVASQISVHEVSRVVRENADLIQRYNNDHGMNTRQDLLVMMEHAI